MSIIKTCRSEWANFYAERVNNRYYNHVHNKYRPFIQLLREEISLKGHEVIVELGCGICNITRALLETHSHCSYWAVDNDPEMLALSQKNLMSGLSGHVNLIQGDILLNYFSGDLAHSHGVLEHFSDEQIQRMIDNQKRCFKTILHYVPSCKYEYPSFGDERLMTPEQWYDICQPTEIIAFNDDYDLILKWDLTK